MMLNNYKIIVDHLVNLLAEKTLGINPIQKVDSNNI